MPEGASLYRRLADALETDWRAIARPEQLPPTGDWTVWLIKAGRGWGKTRTGAEWVRAMVESGAARRIALVGPTVADVRKVMIEGVSGLLSICPDWSRPIYEPSNRQITWPNGAIATTYSAEEPERLRGPQHDAAWADELGAWNNAQETWDQLMFGLRLGKDPRVCVTTTPRPTKLVRDLMARIGKDVVMSGGSTFENRANLAAPFLNAIVGRYAGTRLGRQELEAELLEDVQGALWTRDLIEQARCEPGAAPPMRRVVVAIDPAVTAHEDSDETGIIVAGLGQDGLGYILEDASGQFTPSEWARKAVSLYHRYRADRVIAEVNQGGALVENTLRVVDENVAFRGVHATKGKILRAEPVSALYEQRRVKHAGAFPELEDQMATFAGGSGDSPDRLDATVYALTDLMVGIADGTGIIEFYRRMVEGQSEVGPKFGYTLGAETNGKTVTLRMPEGMSGTFYGITGNVYMPDKDGVIVVTDEDAKAFMISGFTQVQSEAIL